MKNFLTAFLAIVFSIALFFAFIEIPYLLDRLINDSISFPGIDQLSSSYNADLSDLFIKNNYLRVIGYSSLLIMLILIILGFILKKSSLSWLGALGLFLPVFGQFTVSMFFLAGLGVLRVSWLPFIDISYNILGLGEIIFIPYKLLIWFFNLFHWNAHFLIATTLMFLGISLFVWGVVLWIRVRYEKTDVADSWIYRWSRHPQYLGWIIWSYGLILYSAPLNNVKKLWVVSSSLPWLIMTLVIVGLCLLEEIKMTEEYGQNYLKYKKKTPFLLPLPKWLSQPLSLPKRFIIGNSEIDTSWKIFKVMSTYGIIICLLSLPWVIPARSAQNSLTSASLEYSRTAIDSTVTVIRQTEHRRHISIPFSHLELFGVHAVDPLLVLLEDSNAVIREYAALTLGNIKDTSAVQGLERAVSDSVWRVQSEAILALGKFHAPSSWPVLVDLLQGDEKSIDHFIYDALANYPAQTTWDVLLDGLQDSNWYNKKAALNALYKVDPVKTIPIAIEALEDTDSHIRETAVYILLQEKPAEAIPALEKARHDENIQVRLWIEKAIEEIARVNESSNL